MESELAMFRSPIAGAAVNCKVAGAIMAISKVPALLDVKGAV